MSYSRTKPPTSAFTLAEMMVAGAAFTVVGIAILSVLISTFQLYSENTAENMSSYRARQTLDHLAEVIRYAQAIPTQINADGTTATGTTSDGVRINNALGANYLFKNANGSTADIPSGSTSFMIEYAAGAGMAPPMVGDYFLVNLTTQPELEVLTVTSAASVGSVSRALITTRTGLTETASPSVYSVFATRYRKEAYVFSQVGTQWSLLHYSSVISTTIYGSSTAYTVLGTGFQKLNNQGWFTAVLDTGTQAIWLQALARSSDGNEYSESFLGGKSLTTLPVQGKLWNYNAPPPSS